ncbi:MAG: hypothetical protein JWL75_660 [Parcubacteria group bacterium]|nr:hypothetical protein [Parcubacteria group bacterium]
MKNTEYNPLADAEHAIREMHDSTYKHLHPVYRKYPLLFLLVLTFSVAATFQGVNGVLEEITYFKEYPLVLMMLGILGLFVTGSLYKRLGGEKQDEG